jgi:hypothetical protein
MYTYDGLILRFIQETCCIGKIFSRKHLADSTQDEGKHMDFLKSTRTIIAVCMLLFVTLTAIAQVESARVVGTVRDASDAVVPGATVSVTNTETNVTRTAVTGDAGDFVVTDLKPGTYTATVERAGFKKSEEAPFKLDVNQVVRLNVALVIGSADEKVEVTAAEPLIESQTSSIGQVIEEKQVHDLPLNGRNFIQLAYLSPGVNAGPVGAASTVPQQGGVPENERESGAIQVNGLTATNNNFLLNGFDNNEQQIGFEIVQPSVDAIQEFKVQANNAGADIGRGGAVVNVVLKSGTNRLHGSLFEFLRNSAFDAKNYFDDPNSPIPPYKQNQFGGTIGGPIIKDKTFFFFDYQGTRIRQSQTDISTVPTLAHRAGDFSDLPYQLYLPSTTTPNAGTAIPNNNLVPYWNSTAVNIMNVFPKPNLPGSVNNFLYNPLYSNNQNAIDLRVDHQLTKKDSLFGFFSYGNVQAHHPDPMPGLAGGGTFSGTINDDDRAAGVSDVHTFSPNLINEFKLGYFRYVVDATSNFAGQPVATQLGLPGANDPSNLVETGGLPWIQIAGYSGLGNNCCFPEFLRENNYQAIDAVTWIQGTHSFKFGADFRLRKHGFFQALNPTGVLNFDGQYTSDRTYNNPNMPNPNPGDPLATFLLGYPISMSIDRQSGSYGMSWKEFSSYAMDDWRVSSKLTLNLGLRWDLFTPMVEDHNRMANFDFATGQFVAPGMPGVGRSAGVITNWNNFSPRFGFSYTPWKDNLVLRGGFGIFFDQQANQNDAELAFNPGGLFSSAAQNNPPSLPRTTISDGFAPMTPSTLQDPSGRASAANFNNATPYIEEWNLNVERELMKNAVLQVAYVGTHGVHLAHLANLNQPITPSDTNFTDATGNIGRPYFSTVPNIAAIRTELHDYSSISHALQVRFEKRFSSGWSMLDSYTWQHTIGQTEENEYLEPQNTHDLAAERGDNGPDYRHQFTSAWSYELPLGPGKRFASGTGATRWIAGGWQLNGIIALYSGQAFTPLLSYDPTNTGSGAPRPDIVGDPNQAGPVAANPTCVAPTQIHTLQSWYNPCAFVIPPSIGGGQTATQFGDAGRGILRGPDSTNVDLSLFKNFRITEQTLLQFRTEVFNLFNHPQFGLPGMTVDVPGAGSISGTTGSSRQIQFALKLNF